MNYRTIAGASSQLFVAVGYMLLSLIGYIFSNWQDQDRIQRKMQWNKSGTTVVSINKDTLYKDNLRKIRPRPTLFDFGLFIRRIPSIKTIREKKYFRNTIFCQNMGKKKVFKIFSFKSYRMWKVESKKVFFLIMIYSEIILYFSLTSNCLSNKIFIISAWLSSICS